MSVTMNVIDTNTLKISINLSFNYNTTLKIILLVNIKTLQLLMYYNGPLNFKITLRN